jgi:hypothetical protein
MADTKEDMSKSQAKFADPFATREGKTLTWQKVNMTLVRSYQRFILVESKVLVVHSALSHLLPGGDEGRSRACPTFGCVG